MNIGASRVEDFEVWPEPGLFYLLRTDHNCLIKAIAQCLNKRYNCTLKNVMVLQKKNYQLGSNPCPLSLNAISQTMEIFEALNTVLSIGAHGVRCECNLAEL